MASPTHYTIGAASNGGLRRKEQLRKTDSQTYPFLKATAYPGFGGKVGANSVAEPSQFSSAPAPDIFFSSPAPGKKFRLRLQQTNFDTKHPKNQNFNK